MIENDVFVHLEKAIIQLNAEKREGTASSYASSLSSLKAFTNRNKLTFQRAKTAKTTKGNPKMVSVLLQPKQQEIIKHWANEKKSLETYLFPILTEDLSASQERNTIKQKTKLINKYMKEIGKTLGLELLLTTYVARHSFATVLKRGGAPLQVISEMLGHTDLKTTENYLDSFDGEMLEGYAKLLT